MSNFDPNAFLTQEQTVQNETEYTPIPEGDYDAVIKDIVSDVTNGGKPFLNVIWLVDDESVRQHTGMTEPTCRQTVWLDLDANGRLEGGKNKNIGLGKLRAALGQNTGAPWSPSQMLGQPAMVHIAPDKTGQYTNVTQVTSR